MLFYLKFTKESELIIEERFPKMKHNIKKQSISIFIILFTLHNAQEPINTEGYGMRLLWRTYFRWKEI